MVSTVVTKSTHQRRLAALDRALQEADHRFGPIPPELVERAEAELIETSKSRVERPRLPRRRKT